MILIFPTQADEYGHAAMRHASLLGDLHLHTRSEPVFVFADSRAAPWNLILKSILPC